MATRVSPSLHCNNGTDADFRLWTQFIEDTLITTGLWVLTSDTGQTPPGSLVHPTVANTKMGYRIYRMDDPLQATAPVFMRLDFGPGTAGVNVPAFWVTIGMGSDGAGNITNKLWDGGLAPGASVAATTNNTTPCNSYGSAAPNRVSLGLFAQTSPSLPVVFCVERTKNALGADTADGLLLVYTSSGQQSSVDGSRYIILATGVQPTIESGLAYILTSLNPSATYGGDLGVGVISHFKGVAQQPGTNFMVVNSGDVGVEGSFNLTLYGQTRTYQQLNGIVPKKVLVGNSGIDNNARCCIRFD